MFKKVLGKSVAATAVLGAAVAFAPAAAVTAPFANVACNYSAPVATTTDVDVRSVVQYGSRQVVRVSVDAGAGRPPGSVVVRVESLGSRTLELNRGGNASLALPRDFDARRTYTVSASYRPDSCNFRGSGDTAYFTVVKAGTRTNAHVWSAGAAVFSADVRGAAGLDPAGGRATFRVVDGRSRTVRVGKAGVTRGDATVNLRNLPSGRYALKVHYSGTSDFQGSSDSVRFAVR